MKICTKIILTDHSEAHSWVLSTLSSYLPFQSFGNAIVLLLFWPFCTLPSRNLGHTSEMPNFLPSPCKPWGASNGHVKFSARVRRQRTPDGLQAPSIPALLILLPGVKCSFFFLGGGGGERRRKNKGKTQRNMLKGSVAPKVPLPGTCVVLSQSLEWEFSFPQEESEGKQGNRKWGQHIH